MLTWLILSIIFCVLGIGLIIIGVYKYVQDWSDGDIVAIIGVAAFIVSTVSLIICLDNYPVYYKQYEKHVADIISIHRECSIEGNFVLGTGSMKDVQYYFYYHETPNGILLDKVKTENTYIVETDEYKSSIYEIKELHSLNSYNRIYVPYGTIVTTFTLN